METNSNTKVFSLLATEVLTLSNTRVLFDLMNTPIAKEIVKEAIAESVAICGSQDSLAKKTGVSQGAISKYARGDSLPSGVTAKKLEAAVDALIHRSRFAPHIFDSPMTKNASKCHEQ